MPNEYGCQYCWVLAGYGDGGANGGSGGGSSLPYREGYIVISDVYVRLDALVVDGAHKYECSDELVDLRSTVQRALAVDPWLPLETNVTLMLANGQSQTFERRAMSGSLQFFPVSSCS
jgi:hypothetical protein